MRRIFWQLDDRKRLANNLVQFSSTGKAAPCQSHICKSFAFHHTDLRFKKQRVLWPKQFDLAQTSDPSSETHMIDLIDCIKLAGVSRECGWRATTNSTIWMPTHSPALNLSKCGTVRTYQRKKVLTQRLLRTSAKTVSSQPS